jgi:hypothetical protein
MGRGQRAADGRHVRSREKPPHRLIVPPAAGSRAPEPPVKLDNARHHVRAVQIRRQHKQHLVRRQRQLEIARGQHVPAVHQQHFHSQLPARLQRARHRIRPQCRCVLRELGGVKDVNACSLVPDQAPAQCFHADPGRALRLVGHAGEPAAGVSRVPEPGLHGRIQREDGRLRLSGAQRGQHGQDGRQMDASRRMKQHRHAAARGVGDMGQVPALFGRHLQQ